MLNGLDAIALTKLDVLDEIEEIKICVGYRYRGEIVEGHSLWRERARRMRAGL